MRPITQLLVRLAVYRCKRHGWTVCESGGDWAILWRESSRWGVRVLLDRGVLVIERL